MYEQRSIGWTAIDRQTWRLIFEGSAAAPTPTLSGSSFGSKGRIGGGHAGSSWPLPLATRWRCSPLRLGERTRSTAVWLPRWRGLPTSPRGRGSVLASHDRHRSARRSARGSGAMVARVREIQALGSALAWDRPAILSAPRLRAPPAF